MRVGSRVTTCNDPDESIAGLAEPKDTRGANSKGGFFSESAISFSNLQISKKKIFQKTILNLKFNFPAKNTLLLLAANLNFKLRIVLWNIFFEDLEI